MNRKQVRDALKKIEERSELSYAIQTRQVARTFEPKKKKQKHFPKPKRPKNRNQKRRDARTERQNEYRAYLRGSWWKKRRNDYVSKNPICEKCSSSEEIQVHHRVYYRDRESILYKEEDSDLQTLCGECHRKHHNK